MESQETSNRSNEIVPPLENMTATELLDLSREELTAYLAAKKPSHDQVMALIQTVQGYDTSQTRGPVTVVDLEIARRHITGIAPLIRTLAAYDYEQLRKGQADIA